MGIVGDGSDHDEDITDYSPGGVVARADAARRALRELAEVRPVDEGDHRPVLLAIEYALNSLERAHHGSMKTSMVPPQAIPTSKASSSAIP